MSTQIKLAQTTNVQPCEDAEIQTKPNLPRIEDNLPLPADLQNLVKRATSLRPEQKAQLEKALREHHDVFAKDSSSFGKRPWIYFQIDTKNATHIKQAARPIPIHYKQAVFDTIIKWLDCGALVPSQSLWASAILCVPKKNGEVRVCVDYRALNAVIEIPAIPIPKTRVASEDGRKSILSLFRLEQWLPQLIDRPKGSS